MEERNWRWTKARYGPTDEAPELADGPIDEHP